MLRVEFHSHTVFSKDCLTHPQDLISACRRKGVDRIVVTDHNTIEGAVKAQQLDGELVIIGEEIQTTQGEILASFVKEAIPPGLAPEDVIRLLQGQDAFISVSHPFDYLRSGSWKMDELLDIVPLVDAIETFNARCLWPGFNRQAQKFARQHGIPGTAGSDAHTIREIGKATLLLPDFENAQSLKSVIHQAELRASLSGWWVHLASRYAVWRKSRTGSE